MFNGILISYLRLPHLVVTFATSAILFGTALLLRPTPGGYIPRFFYKSYQRDLFHFVPIPLLIFLIGLMVWYFFSRRKVAKYIYAVGGNPDGASASGINVARTTLFAFMISSIFVALAGICVVAQTATGDARSGLGYTLNSVAAAVIGGVSLMGGRGNVLGAVVGGLIIGLLINIIFFANIPSFYQEFTKGVIIIVSIAFGLWPRLRAERRKFAS
jgi:ribose transport system permease protein